jgi:hypothetical protein
VSVSVRERGGERQGTRLCVCACVCVYERERGPERRGDSGSALVAEKVVPEVQVRQRRQSS